ncbi:hypothetical protein QCA50_003556 [Cerrena zonata]|uniref:Uncharacterized protein n=1 Tax=Cerrena zonata TaxID=2478898 RepID=A0AAW0GKM8_9APHY
MSHLTPYHPHHHNDANEFVKIHNGVHIDSPYHHGHHGHHGHPHYPYHPHHGHHNHHHGHPHHGAPVGGPQHGLNDPQNGLLDILGGLFRDVQYPGEGGVGPGGPQHDLSMDPQHGIWGTLGKVLLKVGQTALSDVQYPGAGGPQHDLSVDPQHGLLGNILGGLFSDVQYPGAGAGGPQHDLAADPQHGLLGLLGGLFSDVQYPGAGEGAPVGGPQNIISPHTYRNGGVFGGYKPPFGVVYDAQYPGAGGVGDPQHGLMDIFKGIFSDVQYPGAGVGGPQHGLAGPSDLSQPQNFLQFIGPAIGILSGLLGKQHGLDMHGIAEKAKKDDKISSMIKESGDLDKQVDNKRNELLKLQREKRLLYASLQTRVLHAQLEAASKKSEGEGEGGNDTSAKEEPEDED